MLFLRRIVSLDGLRLDDDTRVTPLVVLTLVGNRSRHVAALQPEYSYYSDYSDDNHLFHTP